MAGAQIDWGRASVRDSTLTVRLTGDRAKAWARRFRQVLALLNRGSADWESIRLARGTITVAGVRPGREDELHHLLESAVAQVNTDLQLAGDLDEPPPPGPHEQSDRAMAERFRDYATKG